ncbi:hypothetical protein [Sorangium sp. So ce176]|uniref:hypothetical protein n=1 Tax=Sorangium sp. So ce176 TaxID=3133286 RepID=UPI003F60D68A
MTTGSKPRVPTDDGADRRREVPMRYRELSRIVLVVGLTISRYMFVWSRFAQALAVWCEGWKRRRSSSAVWCIGSCSTT